MQSIHNYISLKLGYYRISSLFITLDSILLYLNLNLSQSLCLIHKEIANIHKLCYNYKTSYINLNIHNKATLCVHVARYVLYILIS